MTPEEERQAALNSYRAKLIESREWEVKLKNLRLEIKDLQKEFDRTEDNIKALQSVGQIIGEVLKQLDDERCMAFLIRILATGRLSSFEHFLTICEHSYCQGVFRTAVCRRLPVKGRQGKTKAGDPCGFGYDDAHNHADVAS